MAFIKHFHIVAQLCAAHKIPKNKQFPSKRHPGDDIWIWGVVYVSVVCKPFNLSRVYLTNVNTDFPSPLSLSTVIAFHPLRGYSGSCFFMA